MFCDLNTSFYGLEWPNGGITLLVLMTGDVQDTLQVIFCFHFFRMQMLATQGFRASLASGEIPCSSSQYFIATEDTSGEP